MTDFSIKWVDGGREPQCAPNPNYPNGIDVDSSNGAKAACTATLSYPARRCGYYLIVCGTCGHRAAITTAGRPDDPRSLKLACMKPKTVQ